MKKAFKAAFPVTIPVMLGYLFVGIAFGLLFEKSGYGPLWALFMSLIVYAGSMQFVGINLLGSGSTLFDAAILTLFVNLRQIFYGISLLDKFAKMGKRKLYMIFSLTDETYSLLCSAKPPEGVEQNKFYFCIAILNQSYWVMGSLIGALAGTLITFDTTGIEFAMTALFVVIAVEQWLSYKSHMPAWIGAVSTILSFFLFGKDNLILGSMVFITLGLFVFKNKIEGVQE